MSKKLSDDFINGLLLGSGPTVTPFKGMHAVQGNLVIDLEKETVSLVDPGMGMELYTWNLNGIGKKDTITLEGIEVLLTFQVL